MLKIAVSSLVLAGWTTFAAAADYSNTYCEAVRLETAAGQVSLHVSQASLFDGAAPLTLATTKASGEAVTVAGLKADVLKSTLFDATTHTNCGWGCYTTNTKVYTVKLEVNAAETIGFEIMGDVGMPVIKITAYTLCTEATSTPADLH